MSINYESNSRIATAIIKADSIAKKSARRIKPGYACGNGETLLDAEVIGWEMNVVNALSPVYDYWQKKDAAGKTHSASTEATSDDCATPEVEAARKVAKEAVKNVLRAMGEIHGRTLRVNLAMVDELAGKSWRYKTELTGEASNVNEERKAIRKEIKKGGTAEALAELEARKTELSAELSELTGEYDSGINSQLPATNGTWILEAQLILCKYAKTEYAKSLADIRAEEAKKKEHAKQNAKKNRQKNRQKSKAEAEAESK